jgi:hypothetical protein
VSNRQPPLLSPRSVLTQSLYSAPTPPPLMLSLVNLHTNPEFQPGKLTSHPLTLVGSLTRGRVLSRESFIVGAVFCHRDWQREPHGTHPCVCVCVCVPYVPCVVCRAVRSLWHACMHVSS